MDSDAQKAGERRVQDGLIDPLFRLGLLRPAGMAQAQFEAMQAELRAKLAYMSQNGLATLVEQIGAAPHGKAGDRWPIGAHVLRMASAIEPPPADASPLIRTVFAHAVGRSAMAEGWGPELLAHLRRNRVFPSAFVASRLRDEAAPAVRRFRQIEAWLARAEDVRPDDAAWHAERRAQIDKCREIAAMGETDKGAA